FVFCLRPPLFSTLFPYTTLFRSFQGVVLKRHRAGARSTFTVRKVSFNVGVERVFLTHSPRIDKVEIVSRGIVRRARLFYLRDLRSEEHTSELQSLAYLVCRLLLE